MHMPPNIEAALKAHTKGERDRLVELRSLILDVAAETEDVGRIEESLKWGQPSFVAVAPQSGTPLRIGVPKTGGVALYAHCQTTVISQARDMFSEDFTFEGNRAIHLPLDGDWPDAPLRQVIRSALTYRLSGVSDRSR